MQKHVEYILFAVVRSLKFVGKKVSGDGLMLIKVPCR